MCTVTVVPHECGVRLLCNRDERRTRPAALPPQIYDLGGRLAVFPLDPQSGGTWIGLNDAGLVVSLLNLQLATPVTEDRLKRSRGLVVRDLLHCLSLPHAIATVENLDPGGSEPFRVVIVHNGRVAVGTNDGTTSLRCTERTLDKPLLFTSSSLGDRLVARPRQRLFECVVVRSREGWLGGQTHFHQHQWPHRRAISIRMERRDALTVSRTTVDVTRSGRQLLYEAPLDAAAPERVRECCFLP